jgi:hypothetical protein
MWPDMMKRVPSFAFAFVQSRVIFFQVSAFKLTFRMAYVCVAPSVSTLWTFDAPSGDDVS